jgi:hypothetical protein
MAAVAYDLQYTRPLVEQRVAANPPTRVELQHLPVDEHDLVRANLFGSHPRKESQQICTIGIGDGEEQARRAADTAWFDFHASTLFTEKIGVEHTSPVSIHRAVPGTPAQRARTVGVLYELDYIRPLVETAVARNKATRDELHVVEVDDITLMRVNLYGVHPLENDRQICVGGIGDRHFRAVAAAEQAWLKYHTTLLFGAQALAAP